MSIHGLDFRVFSEANSSIVNRKQGERFAETNREADMSTSKNQAGFHLLTVRRQAGKPRRPEHQGDWETVI